MVTVNTLPRKAPVKQECGTCGLNQQSFREMFHSESTGCEFHADFCATCHFDRNTLRDILSQPVIIDGKVNQERANVEELAAACPECSEVFGLEG